MIIIYHRDQVVNPTPPYLLLLGAGSPGSACTPQTCANGCPWKLCISVCMGACGQNKAAIVLWTGSLCSPPSPTPPSPILIPSPLALLPQRGIKPNPPSGGMLDPGGLLRQPGSLIALPWAPPSPPLQRSSESCRFSASSFPLSRASPYATKHDPVDLYFWLHFNPMLCVCVVFLWSSIVCSCKFCFTTCLYKAIRESAVNGSKRWELDEEIDALCLGICIPPAV